MWGDPQKAFGNVRRLITDTPILTYDDQSNITVISADASSSDLGVILPQCNKLVAFSSHTSCFAIH